jgi:hypothetical protein
MVVIPKPNKPDYSNPKAYQPIALLNCLGKVLEKLMASRLSGVVETHDLLHTDQIGGRPERSAIDTAIYLFIYSLIACNRGGNKGGKICKTGWGREEEGGERPGVVAPEQTGLLDKTTRDGLDAEGESIQANMPNTTTALGRFPAGSWGNNRT